MTTKEDLLTVAKDNNIPEHWVDEMLKCSSIELAEQLLMAIATIDSMTKEDELKDIPLTFQYRVDTSIN